MSDAITTTEGAPYDVENELPATLYMAFVAGHLEPGAALRGLALRYREIDQLHGELSRDRDQLRTMIGEVVAVMPQQKAQAAGFELAITGGGETVNYDAKALDSLMAKLLAEGYTQVAGAIADARKTSQRAASLRVTREKAK